MKIAVYSGRIIVWTVLVLVGGGCRRPAAPDPGALHLMDLLAADGIKESPLLKIAPEKLTPAAYPVDSYPLDNISANPLNLKRRHNLGNVDNRILFAPTRSVYRIPLVLPEKPVLDLRFGIVRDHHVDDRRSGQAPGNAGVEFIVRIELDGRERTIFQHHLAPPPLREARTVNYAREKIPLPGGGRKAVLTLLTGGDGGDFAFWHDPLIFGTVERSLPNIVVISLDTLRADHLGAYGYARATSPNIDALAKEGTLFENVYATSPWTLPSHVSMLSGLNCVRHRVYYEDDRIDPGIPLLTARLRDRGYDCGAVTGGGYVSAFYGFSRGFGSYNMSQKEIGSEDNAQEAANLALDWLESSADRPFFLFVHTYQLHLPYGPGEPYKKMFLDPDATEGIWNWDPAREIFRPLSDSLKRNVVGLYDGSIRQTDEVLVKAVVDRLKRLGLYDRTLLIVTSDHGEEFSDHGGWAHTRTLYDEVIKVPLIVHFPGGRHAGTRLRPAVRLVDLAPTILEEAGVPFEEKDFDGRSLRPIVEGREKGDRHFVAELAPNVTQTHNRAATAVNDGRMKIIVNRPPLPEDVAYYADLMPKVPSVELYDLAADPGEKTSVLDRPQHAAAARALVERAEALLKGLKGRSGEKAILPKDLEDRLRALGYIK